MTSPLPEDSAAAVQDALGAEHAAMWAYGLVTAFMSDELDEAVRTATSMHRARRDVTEVLLADAGQTPRPAEPAYVPPAAVTDQTGAIAVLVVAESDATVAWRAVLDRTDDAALRKTALEALTGSAVQAAKWRRVIGSAPTTPALPGKP
jgi:hypothetical protein